MGTNVGRWGNSLAVRLPKVIVEKAGLVEGEALDVKVSSSGDVVLSRARKRYTLDELVAGITPENRHDEIDLGRAVGKEIW
jgi:antitoxin MazE